MRTFRTCVIGVGRVGAEHARILSSLPHSRLVGVCDRNPERADAVARRLQTFGTTDADALLERAHVAVVAVPTRWHAPMTERALRAGCHVLVEKPLASTLREADELIELAESRRLCLGVGHVERYNGIVRACRPLLEAPRFLESLRLAPFQPRGTDVNVVLDLMIHDIDLVLDLVGVPVRAVQAVGVPVISGTVDIANARLIFENGAVANITASRVSSERKRRLRVFQPSGYLSLDLDAGRATHLTRRVGAAGVGSDRGDGVPDGLERFLSARSVRGDEVEPLALELEAFLGAVGGRPSRWVPATQGRAALELALTVTGQIEEFAHVAVAGS